VLLLVHIINHLSALERYVQHCTQSCGACAAGTSSCFCARNEVVLFHSRTQALAKEYADQMLIGVGLGIGAGIIMFLTKSELEEIGHPVPKHLIGMANASLRDTTTPRAEALFEAGIHHRFLFVLLQLRDLLQPASVHVPAGLQFLLDHSLMNLCLVHNN
jgi:hypothetical protein